MRVSGKEVRLTAHARRRMSEMGVDRHEVEQALAHPDTAVRSGKYPGCMNYRRGRICVGAKTEGDEIVVITVVWPSHELWLKHTNEKGGRDGRRVKPWLNL
ncbi:BrnT-like toxin [Rhodococcus phage Jflix2]|nr:BrnT-like toxin [Rhodococcus phage Jflix2]